MIQQITLGPITLHLYGLILGMAIAVGWWWAEKRAIQGGLKVHEFERAAWGAVIGGIIGARLYHVIDLWWYYQNHLWQILAVWQGGLGIWGAVGGGLIGILLTQFPISNFQFPNKNQFSIFKRKMLLMIDAIVLALPLSQAIGRWGNFVNYELFGKPTTLPWGLYIPLQYRPDDLKTTAYYHPLFFYESVMDLGLFLILNRLYKQGWKIGTGKITGGYFIGYGLIRFGLEPLRITMWRLGGIPTAQLVCMVAVGVGGWLILKGRHHETKNA